MIEPLIGYSVIRRIGGILLGYIAPIHHLTYQNYHQRMIKEKSKPFSVDRLYPVHHHLQYESTMDTVPYLDRNFHYSTAKRLDREQRVYGNIDLSMEDENIMKGRLIDVKV